MQTRYARVNEDGVAVEFITISDDGPTLAEMFHPSLVPTFHEAPPGAVEGSIFADGVWGDPQPPPVDLDALAAAARADRDRLLLATDGPVLRHREEGERGVSPTLAGPAYVALLDYRAALRGVTEQPGFPAEIEWPQALA